MSIPERPAATHYRWEDIPLEQLSPTIARKFVSAEKLMIAQVFLKKGAEVPRHSHFNEQITFISSGALQFWLGEDEQQQLIVRAGELLVIPSNVLHRAYAIEDTLDIDIFNPPREDWISGTDSYLRQEKV
jgi:quercetin dioxygenase-like cupin family protein